MISANEKLAHIRSEMQKNSIDAYIIPYADPHLGEYIPDHWQIIPWLCGFTGSAATLVITDSFAGLWTDSRYFIQAEQQLAGSGFELKKAGNTGSPDYSQWIAGNLNEKSVVAFDGRTFSVSMKRKLESVTARKNISILSDCDLISELWTDRLPLSSEKAFDHPIEFCGKDRARKISEIREQMKIMNIDYHLLTSPEDVMWMLNIRGKDLKYSSLLLSFVIVGMDQILFFAEENKIPMVLARTFDDLNIIMLPYEETDGMISTLPSDSTILLNPLSTSVLLQNAIPPGMKIVEDISIPTKLKSVKNKVELENISRVMVKDGVALSKFFYWFENQPPDNQLTELQLAEKILEFRAKNTAFLGPSFSTIVAYGENGALPHYSPATGSNSIIGNESLLMIDSGGQYLDGTTDITRTISTGKATAKQKKDFTLVLKGMIGLATARFPSGTKGYQLDILARKFLWENGLNYGHGTGHGVGFCLNVHEGPQSISPMTNNGSKTPIEPGMLISNEPAIYREGEYGIRTENLIVCYEYEETEFGQFLGFDTVSLCYIDKSLLDISMLDEKEINWLDSYHMEVFDKVSPFLSEAENEWLKKKTSALQH